MSPTSTSAEVFLESLLLSRLELARRLGVVWSDTKACTRLLTSEIALRLSNAQATVQYERKVDLKRRTRAGKEMSGHLDLFGSFKDGSSIAIEIDRKFKAWSLSKLQHANDSGSFALWIRWDGLPPPYRYTSVRVLDLTMAESFATEKITKRVGRREPRTLNPSIERTWPGKPVAASHVKR